MTPRDRGFSIRARSNGTIAARWVRVLAMTAMFCATPVSAAAQDASVQGIVTSAETGLPLEGVAVTLNAGARALHLAFTDRNGFYQIGGIEPGTYTLRSQQLGYSEHEQVVSLVADERLRASFELELSAVALERIEVAPERGAAVRELGRQRVTPIELRRIPVPAGSGDLASYLQTMPGVTTTGDRGGQLFVRGGTASENLVLVDGILIYQPFHILGFFSVFPEDLVSSVDFYAGGFGARYQGRTSSVLDVRLRDGDQNDTRAMVSVSPFIAEALVEGPWEGGEVKWIASMRRSLVEETSGTLLGRTQPFTFESQLLKVTSTRREDERCGLLALRTADRGRTDPEEATSRVAWDNLLAGLRCVTLRSGRLYEVNFSFSRSSGDAVSRGSSALHSSIWRVQHDAHTTTMIGSIPLNAGYHAYLEGLDYDLADLFRVQSSDQGIFAAGAYVEAAVPIGSRVDTRLGVAVTASPRPGIEPRLRASWSPFGRSTETLQGAVGLYRQYVVGTSDMRDVSSVFTAWMNAPDDEPVEAVHAILGWQQVIGPVRWSVEGYHKRMKGISVPRWTGVARFTTQLVRADGASYGIDARIEYTKPGFYAFVGYGYGWTQYEAAQAEFGTWFGEPVQRYHPPHDRRHQLNAVTSFDIAGFEASARWQFGTGLPFTRPIGFDEAFDFTKELHDVHQDVGTTRVLLDRPFTGRLPIMHRLDLSLQRDFDVSLGRLSVQAGVINAYDRRNMFYYDLFTGRRADQLSLAPYASVTLRGQ